MPLPFLDHNLTVVDLTHSLRSDNPTWDGECGFSSRVVTEHQEAGYLLMEYNLIAGVGTHMDAPYHFFADGKAIHELEPEKLVAPLHLINSPYTNEGNCFVPVEAIHDYEKKQGKILPNSFIIANTHWAQFWNSPEKYRNADETGRNVCPGFSIEAVELLLDRKICGIGIDTLSPDGGRCDFPVHELILGSGLYIVENLTNLEQLPPKGALVLSLPPKIHGGSEAPCRTIALVPVL